MQEIDFKEIKKACKPPVPPKCIISKPKIDNEKQFNRDAKKFYNLPLSEASEMSNAVNQFYRPETSKFIDRKELSSREEINRFKNVGRPQSSSTANLNTKTNKKIEVFKIKIIKKSDWDEDLGWKNGMEWGGLNMIKWNILIDVIRYKLRKEISKRILKFLWFFFD